MFTSIFESASDLSGITFSQAAICIIAAFIIGIIIAAVYMFTGRYSQNFIITIVLLPVVIQAVIIMVNGSLGTGIAVLGAFSLIRFRSVQGTGREILAIFLSMALGLCLGSGYLGVAGLLFLLYAVMVLECDQEVPAEALNWLKKLEGVLKVTYLSLLEDIADDRIERKGDSHD